MRVAVFLTYNNSLKTWLESGTIDRELKLFEELSKNYGYKFLFVTYGNIDDNQLIKKYKNFEVLPLNSVFSFSSNKYFNFLKSLLFPLKIRSYLNDIDILYQNQLKGAWVTLVCKLLIKKPLVVRTGYDLYKFSIHENKKSYKLYFYKLLTNLSLKYSDKYTVTSKTENLFIKKNYKFDSKKLVTIPNWIYEGELNNDKRNKKSILSVGRFVHQKNFEQLIFELEGIDGDYNIDLIGDGGNKEKLKNLADNLNIKINFLGKLKNDQLQELYKNYQFYITTALFEGNPKTVLEAMSNGCVVIASDIPNHRELIEDDKNGFLIDLKKPNILNLLNKINNDSKKIFEIQSNAINSVNKENSLNSVVEKYNNLFLEIIS